MKLEKIILYGGGILLGAYAIRKLIGKSPLPEVSQGVGQELGSSIASVPIGILEGSFKTGYDFGAQLADTYNYLTQELSNTATNLWQSISSFGVENPLNFSLLAGPPTLLGLSLEEMKIRADYERYVSQGGLPDYEAFKKYYAFYIPT